MPEEVKDQTPEKEQTLAKIERLTELADKLEELERLKRIVRIQSYDLERMRTRHEREDKLKRILLCFFAGFCYGLLTIAILES